MCEGYIYGASGNKKYLSLLEQRLRRHGLCISKGDDYDPQNFIVCIPTHIHTHSHPQIYLYKHIYFVRDAASPSQDAVCLGIDAHAVRETPWLVRLTRRAYEVVGFSAGVAKGSGGSYLRLCG